MRKIALFALVIALAGSAVAQAKPAPRSITMPESWKRRYVPKKFQQEGQPIMVASFVRPDVMARLFVWAEVEGSTPKDLAEALVSTTISSKGIAAIVSTVQPPNVGVYTFDPFSGRGGYSLFILTQDGRVTTLDADYAPENGEEIIKEIDEIGAQIH